MLTLPPAPARRPSGGGRRSRRPWPTAPLHQTLRPLAAARWPASLLAAPRAASTCRWAAVASWGWPGTQLLTPLLTIVLVPCVCSSALGELAKRQLPAEAQGPACALPLCCVQDLDGYMREVRKKQAAREGAAAAAARAREVRPSVENACQCWSGRWEKSARSASSSACSPPTGLDTPCPAPNCPWQERELASCTFHPSLGHQRRPSPTKAGGPGEAPAAGSCVPAINSARPPDVLAQVEALLHGEQPVGSDVEHGAQGEPAAGRGSGQATTGGAGGAAAGGFSAFLGHVTAELRRMQAE